MISFVLSVFRLLKSITRAWSIPMFRAAFSLALVILLSGTLFYHGVEGWSWIDSLYFSVTTASTVGHGDLAPKTDFGKIFTVIYIFVGVGVFVVLFSQLARAMLNARRPDDEARPDGPQKPPGPGNT